MQEAYAFCSFYLLGEPPPTVDDLRACPHFPSIPDSQADQVQVKALLRNLGYQGRQELGQWGANGKGEGPRMPLWGGKTPAWATGPLRDLGCLF